MRECLDVSLPPRLVSISALLFTISVIYNDLQRLLQVLDERVNFNMVTGPNSAAKEMSSSSVIPSRARLQL